MMGVLETSNRVHGMSFCTHRRYRNLAWVVVLTLAASFARIATADEVGSVKTRGEGWFETCWGFGISICTPHAVELPEIVTVGDIVQRLTQDGDFGPFEIESINQEDSGNCFLYNSDYGDIRFDIMWGQPRNVIYLGKCDIINEKVLPVFVREAVQRADFLGQVTGMSNVCADSPKLSQAESKVWTERTLTLHGIQINYGKKLAETHETAGLRADVAFSESYVYQSDKNRDKILNDPDACTGLAVEIEQIISEWNEYLDTEQ